MTRRRAAEQLPRLPFVSTPVLTEEKNGGSGSPHEQISLAISPQVTPRGVELSVDQAQAVTYRRARVTARRMGRREHRQERRAVRRGY
jgi:hypothetical protein